MSRAGDRYIALKLVALAAGMFGFGYLLVPLYDVFCEITGIGGRTSGQVAGTAATSVQPDYGRSVRVEFVASVNEGGPWQFRADQSSMTIHPGQLYTTSFWAENRSDRAVVGQAVPSVAPGQAAKYFSKTECFCFTEQRFEPGEGRHMPVTFIIDPELPGHLDTVTLSYTFFDQVKLAGNTGT